MVFRVINQSVQSCGSLWEMTPMAGLYNQLEKLVRGVCGTVAEYLTGSNGPFNAVQCLKAGHLTQHGVRGYERRTSPVFCILRMPEIVRGSCVLRCFQTSPCDTRGGTVCSGPGRQGRLEQARGPPPSPPHSRETEPAGPHGKATCYVTRLRNVLAVTVIVRL